MSASVFKSQLKAYRKALIKSSWIQGIIVFLVCSYVRFVHKTSRWRVMGEDRVQECMNNGNGFIVAFWHNRLAMMSFLWQKRAPFFMLISAHSDGQIIGKIVEKLGISHVSGSKTRGGLEALKKMLMLLQKNQVVGVTPDGPRGPVYEVHEGIVHMARLSQKPIICATYAMGGFWQLKTWDRFIVPKPFQRGVKLWGEVLPPPPRDAPEAAISQFTHKLFRAMELCRHQAEDELKRDRQCC